MSLGQVFFSPKALTPYQGERFSQPVTQLCLTFLQSFLTPTSSNPSALNPQLGQWSEPNHFTANIYVALWILFIYQDALETIETRLIQPYTNTIYALVKVFLVANLESNWELDEFLFFSTFPPSSTVHCHLFIPGQSANHRIFCGLIIFFFFLGDGNGCLIIFPWRSPRTDEKSMPIARAN